MNTIKQGISGQIIEQQGSINVKENLAVWDGSDFAPVVSQQNISFMTPQMFGAKGDGITDDTDAINQTFSASGGNVHFPAGSYLISNRIYWQGDANITADPSAILLAASTFPQGGSENSMLDIRNSEYCRISGLTFDGNIDNLLPSITGWTNFIYGINIQSVNNVEIDSCVSIHTPSISFNVSSAIESVKITNCISDNAMYHGIFVQQSNNVEIKGNRILGLGVATTNTAVGGIGILINRCDGVKCHSNYVKDTPDTGTKTEGCNNVSYIDNDVINSGKDGIKIQGYTGIDAVFRGVIIGNRVTGLYSSRSDGSSLITTQGLSQATIIGNVITGTKDTGGTPEDAIRVVKASALEITDIVIAGNVIYDPLSVGINVQDAVKFKISDNIIHYVRDFANNGIALTNCVDFYVKNNTIIRNAVTASSNGIFSSASSNGTICDNIINNTLIAVNAQLVSCDHFTISGNNITDTNREAISILVSSSNPIVVDSLNISGNYITRPCNTINSNGVIRVSQTNLTINKLSFAGCTLLANGALVPNSSIQFSGSGATFGLIDINGLNITDNPFPSFQNYTRIIGYFKSGAAPTNGAWKAGDIVYHQSPASAGNVGWICTTAGSPGTWLQFGYVGDISTSYVKLGGQTPGTTMVLGTASGDTNSVAITVGGTSRLLLRNDTSLAINGYIRNWNALANSNITLADTGTQIARDVADASPVMQANNQNVGSTGNLFTGRKAGTQVMAIDINGFYDSPSTTTTIDFGSVSANSELAAPSTITLTGAAVGDCVLIGAPNIAGIVYKGVVSSANTITLYACNFTTAPIDPASGSFKITVIK